MHIDWDMTPHSNFRNYVGHLIYKLFGTLNFIRQIEWRSMLEWLDPKEGERILDVACGKGTLSLKIAEKGCEVYGIDMSWDAIKNAKRLAEREGIAGKFEVESAEDLPYPDGYFDKIVRRSSLEYFKDDIKERFEISGLEMERITI